MYGQVPLSGDCSTLLDNYARTLSKSLLQQRANFAERVSRQEAERASRLKSDFIANMSHELRTPLNAVMGFAELIMKAEERELSQYQVMEYAQHIHASSEHLLTVINDILDISKIQSGRVTLDSTVFNLPQLISQTVALFEPRADQSGLKLALRIAPEIGDAKADKAKLRQILINLIDNAIKYTKPPGTVSVVCEGIDRSRLKLSIIDTGIGMTEDELELACIPFAQVDSSHTRDVQGTGLGLSIAEALVKLHGGEMDISSARNIGTEIQLLLPINNLQPSINSRPVSSTQIV